jgi:hypothetical protein
MKSPKPSFLERLTGKTVEMEAPGPDGRPIKRTVSKKWFDAMVAQGKIQRIDKGQLEENARFMVRLARLTAVNSFVSVLDRFPQLGEVQPESWDFFLTIAGVQAGLSTFEIKAEASEINSVREVVLRELSSWDTDGPRALLDCEAFVQRSMAGLYKVGTSRDWRNNLQSSIGMWIVWNLLRRTPSDSDLGLVTAVGLLESVAVDDWWSVKRENT